MTTAHLPQAHLPAAAFGPPSVVPPRRPRHSLPDEGDEAARDAALCARFEEEERLRAGAECALGCDWSDGAYGGPW